MINVLIVDDQLIFRESLKYLIEQDQEIHVVGCAGDGMEALRFCAEFSPEIVLMDIMMPICDGVTGTQRLKESFPAIKVMILTTFDDVQNIAGALKYGADAYILKDIHPESLILAIKSLAQGLPVIHQKAFSTIVKGFQDNIPVGLTHPAVNSEFTEREMAIIRMIVDGKSNKEIAAAIHFSEGSVKNMITVILEKLNLKDRTQLAVFAVKNQWV